jgi:hypothetical protein
MMNKFPNFPQAHWSKKVMGKPLPPKLERQARCRWLSPVILTIWEADTWRIIVSDKLGQKTFMRIHL